MKSITFVFLWVLLNSTISWSQGVNSFESKFTSEHLSQAPARLIPFPRHIGWENEFLEIKDIYVDQAESLSSSLSNALNSIVDFYSIRISKEGGYPIFFKNNGNLGKEEYHLTISKNGIEIEAVAEPGHFYALQTLRQLIQTKQGKQVIPICKIKDAPAFPVRGYMIDVGRNFQSLASLKKQLDIMAKYKLNVFHWHLTDRPAWRIESKKYPELNAAKNHRPTRDPGKFYTYDDIRALIQFAKERNITIIPEIDMPGHSDSFVKSMGVKMESKEGMKILENVLNEFFQEIPVSDCPIIHIGSDEVRIPDPDEFISNMVNICEKNGRKVVVWNPGLKAGNKVIRQTWQTKHVEKATFQEIDSWNNYVNNGEPMTQVQRLFFKPIGYPSDNEVIGGILCFWPDVNIENETDAFFQNPVFPSMLTYAWKTWTADITYAPEKYYMTLPSKGSAALNYFAAFEEILLHHKNIFFENEPFQYYSQNDKVWQVIGTFIGDEGDDLVKNVKDSYSYQGKKLSWQNAVGNTLVIKDRFKLGGYFPNAKKGQTAYALTYIHSDKSRTVDAWIGFESPMRANRTYSGIPAQGTWDANGGNIWINDKPISSPEWKNPRWKPSKNEGWGSPQDQETPWGKEELYWTRTPSKVALIKGWNKVFVKIPGSSDYQNWMFTFVPLNMEGLSFSSNLHSRSTYYYQRKSLFRKLPNDKDEIIFIGDSIIDGGEWSEMFGNKKIKNRGISGDVTEGVLDRLDEVTESQPKKVFLMIGINDLARGFSAEQVVENTHRIVDEIKKASPGTRIFLQSLLPVSDHFEKFVRHTDKNEEVKIVNSALQKMEGGNVVFIDLHNHFLNEDNKLNITYSNDGLHLNGEGYAHWALLIKKFVK
jgi:lysophospholipase L1-like esterase